MVAKGRERVGGVANGALIGWLGPLGVEYTQMVIGRCAKAFEIMVRTLDQ